jgi:hypothetical protein
MTPQEEETLWRNRFILVNVVRIVATIDALLGILLWQSDVFVEGGSIVGLPIAVIGVVVSFLGPRWLAAKWRTPPQA